MPPPPPPRAEERICLSRLPSLLVPKAHGLQARAESDYRHELYSHCRLGDGTVACLARRPLLDDFAHYDGTEEGRGEVDRCEQMLPPDEADVGALVRTSTALALGQAGSSEQGSGWFEKDSIETGGAGWGVPVEIVFGVLLPEPLTLPLPALDAPSYPLPGNAPVFERPTCDRPPGPQGAKANQGYIKDDVLELTVIETDRSSLF